MCYRRLITPRSSMTSPSSASVIIGEGRRSMARANENRTTRRPDDLRRDASEPREPSPCTLSGTESPAADRAEGRGFHLSSNAQDECCRIAHCRFDLKGASQATLKQGAPLFQGLLRLPKRFLHDAGVESVLVFGDSG